LIVGSFTFSLAALVLCEMNSYMSRLLMQYSPSHRHLEEDESSGTPGWVDFLVVAVLVFIFYRLLKGLMALSQKWTE
jgi:hypothetical protein